MDFRFLVGFYKVIFRVLSYELWQVDAEMPIGL